MPTRCLIDQTGTFPEALSDGLKQARSANPVVKPASGVGNLTSICRVSNKDHFHGMGVPLGKYGTEVGHAYIHRKPGRSRTGLKGGMEGKRKGFWKERKGAGAGEGVEQMQVHARSVQAPGGSLHRQSASGC